MTTRQLLVAPKYPGALDLTGRVFPHFVTFPKRNYRLGAAPTGQGH
jgi:hypothetical protein